MVFSSHELSVVYWSFSTSMSWSCLGWSSLVSIRHNFLLIWKRQMLMWVSCRIDWFLRKILIEQQHLKHKFVTVIIVVEQALSIQQRWSCCAFYRVRASLRLYISLHNGPHACGHWSNYAQSDCATNTHLRSRRRGIRKKWTLTSTACKMNIFLARERLWAYQTASDGTLWASGARFGDSLEQIQRRLSCRLLHVHAHQHPTHTCYQSAAQQAACRKRAVAQSLGLPWTRGFVWIDFNLWL